MAGNEPPLKPVLPKPPGYKYPNNAPRPAPRRPVLPQSFSPKRKHRSFRRRFCCCFCIFLLILILCIVIFGAVFYIWFSPRFPAFHLKSFRMTRFNMTQKPDGTYLDAAATSRIEMKNPNKKMKFNYGAMDVAVSVITGEDETELGSASLPKFSQDKRNTTSLKVETKVSNQLVDDGVGARLKARYRSKDLVPNVEARTKVGVGIWGLRIGKLGVTVKCRGVSMKRLEGGDMPKCTINLLKWINIH